MKKYQYLHACIGDTVYTCFGNSYRRCKVEDKSENKLYVACDAIQGNTRLARWARYQSVDLTKIYELPAEFHERRRKEKLADND